MTNGGQQTNCRINALANEALSTGHSIELWYAVTEAERLWEEHPEAMRAALARHDEILREIALEVEARFTG